MGPGSGDVPGGIFGLCELLSEHGEAVEADLQRFYGLPLTGLADGTLSWRRLAVLVRQLPRESATARRQMGEAAAWGLAEHLLASVVDVLAVGNWQRAGNKRAPRPKPLPRPGRGTAGGKRWGTARRTVEEMRERLARPRVNREG